MTWRGRGSSGIEQDVRQGEPLKRLQPWLATEIAPAPSAAKGNDFVVQWRAAAGCPFTSWQQTRLAGDGYETRRQIDGEANAYDEPTAAAGNNQPDPNKTLRQEKPIELPPPAKSKESAAKTVSDSAITVLVPVELAYGPVYDVTVQAQSVAPDKKVLATAYAPVRRLAVVQPLLVKLAGPARISVSVDPKKGGSVKIVGKIERQPGVTADIAVWTGLPAARADAVTLKAKRDFALNVNLPANVPPGEFEGPQAGRLLCPGRQTTQRPRAQP